jgi:predicted enzyme related to lactoylglutathione lyase
MAAETGRFVWYELMTTDIEAAKAFYTKVVGWGVQDSQMPGMQYWMYTMGDAQLAGLMDLPQEARQMGTPPSWIGYVLVENVDTSAELATQNGGRVYVPGTDIPGVGRFAIVADPAGAALGLLQSANPEQDMLPDQRAPGRVGWHELYGDDPSTGFDFYAKLFGWQKQESMDMGDMGAYQIFGKGEGQLGGMMRKPPMVPVSYWAYYFNVGNIDEAAERVKSAGGQILNGPMDVPGGGWIVQGMDPQGAAFALFGTK